MAGRAHQPEHLREPHEPQRLERPHVGAAAVLRPNHRPGRAGNPARVVRRKVRQVGQGQRGYEVDEEPAAEVVAAKNPSII